MLFCSVQLISAFSQKLLNLKSNTETSVQLFSTNSSLGFNQTNNCTTSLSPCSGHGSCMPNGKCVCNDCYVTHNSTEECNYKQMKALKPFLFEIFLGGLGTGWFVIGDVGKGVGQLLYLIPGICVIIGIATACGLRKDFDLSDTGSICGGCLLCGWFCGFIAFWLFSVIAFATGMVNDMNNVELCPL